MSRWFEKFPRQVGNQPVCVGETGKSATSATKHVEVGDVADKSVELSRFIVIIITCMIPLRTQHLGHISSLMLAWCKEGTVSQVLSYRSVVLHLLLHNNIYCCTIYTGLVQAGLLCGALSPWA